MSEINMGTLYEYNKAIMKNQPILTYKQLEYALEALKPWIKKIEMEDGENYIPKYYMLLCNDLRDFTLFYFKENRNRQDQIEIFLSDITECFENRYFYILSVELNENNNCVEIWVRREADAPFSDKDEKEAVYCYHLFPYDNGVIEYD